MSRLWNRTGVGRGPWWAAAFLALAVFVLGAASHFHHHLVDPHCEQGPASESHPCVACSSLHGAAVAEGLATVAPAAPHTSFVRVLHVSELPADSPRGVRAARPPPRG